MAKIKPPLRWVPTFGLFTQGFLERVASNPNGPTIQDLTTGDTSALCEAQRILGRCLPPNEPSGRETGIVVGYVQSGKTLSFETVISLARDNGFGVVVVLAGTKDNLREQSEKRLKQDLNIDEGENWYHISNPTKAANARQIGDKLKAWRKDAIRRRAVLITVLKQKDRLSDVTATLDAVDLHNTPVLIIDDEGDQASLNTYAAKIRSNAVPANKKSTIYDSILKLRDVIPHHSFLQYTATPQANLLLAQTDLLQASFAELVTPGAAYTGGTSFFRTPQTLVTTIPPADVPTKTNTVRTIPKSLLSALRYFLLASAHHAITRVRPGSKDRNRTLMVHPAMQTTSHTQYKKWVVRALSSLHSFVEKNHKTNKRAVSDLFQREFDLLRKTFPEIRSLGALVDAMIDDVFPELNTVTVNSTKDAEKHIDWKQTPYWILVGGNKLDRGYTVEGLCTTYMPRALGKVPNADTLQQRARFFGYKQSYLGLCRVFIQNDVREAFTRYVEHEEFVRKALETARGRPLSDWRRDFILTDMLRPTRPNVVGLQTYRVPVNGWIVPDVMQRDEASVALNQAVMTASLKSWQKQMGPAINAADISRFNNGKGKSANFAIEGLPLRAVLEDFLLKIAVKDPTDAEAHSAILIALAELLRKTPGLLADVFLMNNLEAGYRTRIAGRGVAADHPFAPINQYFSQSANALNDSHFQSGNRISIQLRKFNLGTTKRSATTADIKDVPWFALHVPSQLRKDLVIEAR